MSKSRSLLLTFGSVMLVIGVMAFAWLGLNQPKYLNDSDLLYDAAIQHLLDNDNSPEKNNKGYHRFADYQGYDITEDDTYKYAYMWIFDESFYVNDKDHITLGTGGSMPYKFFFDKTTDAVVKYETPQDGINYAPSIKRMFPGKVAREMLKISSFDDTKLMSEVKEYYNYLSDTEIYYGLDE